MQNYRIKFAFKHVNSPVACCALSTKVGTRNENPEYNGLAHFNEHMLFKGTEKRGSVSINNVLENVGGELNAYTTKEETVIHATVLKEDLKKAINLLFELAFTSVYPQKELVKEIEVVYEEIISYKDSPAESIYDDFESLLYSGHPLSLQILGQKKTLNKITPAILKNYLSEFFIPENMAITIVADYSELEVVKMINSALKHFKKECVCSDNLNADISENYNKVEFADKNLLFNSNKPFYIERLKHNHQAHCIIGNRAYSFYDEKKRLALAMLTNILGGPATNSRLNMVLRERNALVYNVEAMYNCYLDSGVFAIYFGCDKSLVEKCLSLIYKELECY
jgi:Predicted Zn-dependent peptidases